VGAAVKLLVMHLGDRTFAGVERASFGVYDGELRCLGGLLMPTARLHVEFGREVVKWVASFGMVGPWSLKTAYDDLEQGDN
jgi:hypothetical protein